MIPATPPRFVSAQLVAKLLRVEVLKKGVLIVTVAFHSNEKTVLVSCVCTVTLYPSTGNLHGKRFYLVKV